MHCQLTGGPGGPYRSRKTKRYYAMMHTQDFMLLTGGPTGPDGPSSPLAPLGPYVNVQQRLSTKQIINQKY